MKLTAGLATLATLLVATSAPSEPAAGNWMGAIDGHIISLVHLERATDGTLTGTFASHDIPQTTPDFRAVISNVKANADNLTFEVPSNSGIFDGRWDNAKKAWVGSFQWGKGGYKSALSLSRTNLQSLPEGPFFDATAKSQAVKAAAKLLNDDYVFPDVGSRAAAVLTQNLTAAKYDSAPTPGDFAAQLTKDLQDFTHDKHLRVYADCVYPNDLPPGPPASIGLYGFAQVDRLQGNIGYITLNSFAFSREDFKLGADKAMALMASTDALIIDLRNNHGGQPVSVNYFISFFFNAKAPVHVNDGLVRKPGTAHFRRGAFSTEPTPVSYLRKPVYLITGAYTFSGGEAFAYHMQALKRATLVGEVTRGGAHNVVSQPIGSGLSLIVPVGRTENAITHTDWEGKGVQPDLATPADQSFITAYSAALHALGRQTSPTANSAESVTDAYLLVLP